MPTLAEALERRLAGAKARLQGLSPAPTMTEFGIVERVGDGVAAISGLDETRLDELLVFAAGARGTVVSLDRDHVGAVLLDPWAGIAAGSEVRGTGEVVRVPVGPQLLGRILDPLGRPLDGGPEILALRRDPIERPAPRILDRALVTEPLHTGVLVVDAMIPIGRGQRELIIGDRSTGKTAIAVDAILSQRTTDVVCVYAAVGQKASTVGRVIDTVRKSGPFERTVFIVAEADHPPGLQWIAPFSACSIAEYFRDEGGHALLVIDDLSKHAIIHRQISLLLRYPPGREAYPGDIFYLHARLLERAAKLSPARGGGSLTALPIAETQAGNISAYIPTNLISITDGQVYLDPKLFYEGHKPAVSIGRSVSRVGGKTQSPAIKTLSETLKLDYSQFLELEVFTRFGQMIDPRTQRAIDRGRRIRAALEQPEARPLSTAAQAALLLALHDGVLDPIALDQVEAFKQGLEQALDTELGSLAAKLNTQGTLDSGDRASMLAWLQARARQLSGEPATQ